MKLQYRQYEDSDNPLEEAKSPNITSSMQDMSLINRSVDVVDVNFEENYRQ